MQFIDHTFFSLVTFYSIVYDFSLSHIKLYSGITESCLDKQNEFKKRRPTKRDNFLVLESC